MKLIREIVEQVKFLKEETSLSDGSKVKNYFIEGIFIQSEVQNRNGRIYPKEILEREIGRYNKEYVTTNRAFGELGHPDGPSINLDRVSHIITSLKADGNNFIGRAKISNTPFGNIVKGLLDDGASLGVSSRGLGSLQEDSDRNCQIVCDDFYLATAADIVADPSAPDAYVQGIMEGKEWIWNNGILKEADIATSKKVIQKTSSKQLKKVSISEFSKFLKSLSGK